MSCVGCARRVQLPDLAVRIVCQPGPGVFFRRDAFERAGFWDGRCGRFRTTSIGCDSAWRGCSSGSRNARRIPGARPVAIVRAGQPGARGRKSSTSCRRISSALACRRSRRAQPEALSNAHIVGGAHAPALEPLSCCNETHENAPSRSIRAATSPPNLAIAGERTAQPHRLQDPLAVQAGLPRDDECTPPVSSPQRRDAQDDLRGYDDALIVNFFLRGTLAALASTYDLTLILNRTSRTSRISPDRPPVIPVRIERKISPFRIWRLSRAWSAYS